MSYQAPVKDMLFTIRELAGLECVRQLPGFEDATDDTVAVARRVLPSIRIVPQQGRGKGAALRTGFAAAKGDIIVMIDADGSTQPEEIPAFIEALTPSEKVMRK